MPQRTSDVISDRANAYQFWVLHPPTTGPLPQFSTDNPIIVKGGYLIRSVNINGGTLALTGDLNNTASFEIIAPAAQSQALTFNGVSLPLSKTSYGTLTAMKTANLPSASLPNLSALTWVINSFFLIYYRSNFFSFDPSNRKQLIVFLRLGRSIPMHCGLSRTTPRPSTLPPFKHQCHCMLGIMASTLGISSGALISQPRELRLRSRSMSRVERHLHTLFGWIQPSSDLGKETWFTVASRALSRSPRP